MMAALLCLGFSLNAQAPEPAKLPGEPHHHLKFENAYVRVYFVEVAAHDETQLHQHDHDYVFFSLGQTDVINAILDKPEVRVSLKDGDMRFTRGNFAHVARNVSDEPFRNIAIEFLRPQGEPENLCAQVVLAKPVGICDRTLVSAKDRSFSLEPEMEMGETEVDLVKFEGKKCDSALRPQSLIVSVDAPGIQVNVDGTKGKSLYQGEVMWIGREAHGYVSNLGKEPSRYLQLTFNDSAPKAKR